LFIFEFGNTLVVIVFPTISLKISTEIMSWMKTKFYVDSIISV